MLLLASPPTTLFIFRLLYNPGDVCGDANISKATLKLPSGQLVKTWGLHPKPPVPAENDRSTARDKELMKVAFKAKRETLPVIIMGDLNDVAWSYVTGLLSKTSGLLDPRRGRGFYSTFSSYYWLCVFSRLFFLFRSFWFSKHAQAG